jgi:dihydroflavonol-4-reductase
MYPPPEKGEKHEAADASMNILVTGATGFVGNVLMGQLIKVFPDCGISAFVLPDDPFKKSLCRYEGIRVIEGDVTKRENVFGAVRGHTHVIHLAGFISYWRKDRKKLMQVNVLGVQNIVDACLEQKVRKLVHISSVGACGFLMDGKPATEDSPFNWPEYFGYMVSKHEGQKIVEKACKEKDLDGVILMPASIMGPGDADPSTPHSRLYERIYKKRLFGCFAGGLAVIDVRDLVEIIIKALNTRLSGEKYLVLGWNVSYSRVVRGIGKHADRKTYPFPIPAFLLSIAGGALEIISYFTRRNPLLTYAYGRLSGWKVFYSNEKSKRDFAHAYRPFEKTIEDGCRYFEKKHLF